MRKRQKRDPLYWVWSAIVQRCTNPKNHHFKNYGGRGIRICDKWRNSYSAFATDIGPRPPGMTIERINNDGDYEPRNCRWATRTEQASNKRNCIYVMTGDGHRITLTEYCRRHGFKYRAVVKRIQDRGWPLAMALSIPVAPGGKGGDAVQFWGKIEELRDYLSVALQAANGRPVLERLLDEAQIVCDSVPVIGIIA